MTERFDVVVIGGGPSGCAAAITAARRSRNVLLLERGRYPRHKVCGEFVSAESLELLAMLLSGTTGERVLTDAQRIRRTRVFLEGGSFEAPIEPAAASVSRHVLDEVLWSAAVEVGVDARQECGGYRIAQRDGVVVGGDGADVECERIVHATGRQAQKQESKRLVGIKAHFRADQPLDSVDLYFGREGYCGVQPLEKGLVNVCALVDAENVRRPASERMRAAFDVHTALLRERWEQITETVTTGALTFGDPEPVRNGIVQAGDAAGFIDPFLGDGISLALQSGAMAGDIDDVEAYGAEYRRRFLPVFRRAARLRRLLDAPKPMQKAALLLLKWPGVAATVVEKTRASARNACARKTCAVPGGTQNG